MRLPAAVACGLLMLSACSPTPIIDSAPPTTERALTQTQTTPTYLEGPIHGFLPDGTPFEVIFEPLTREKVTGISAGIVVEVEEGTIPLGEVSFLRSETEAAGWSDDNLYRTGTGRWTLEIAVSDQALSLLGPDPKTVVAESIEVSTNVGLPIVSLAPPLRWTPDDQIPMRVTYETFEVRRGCDEDAVACNSTHAVQVIPLAGGPADPVVIESYALRPADDPHRIDPGPLSARRSHDVLWSGAEMIVWGGATDERPNTVEGAAFDPHSDRWRMIPGPPLQADQPTRAAWAGDELIVVSPEATVAYDPGTNTWTSIGSGVTPPTEPGLTLSTGGEVVAWTPDGIQTFDPELGTWTTLPDPGLGGGGRSKGVLRTLDGRLYAIGGECDRREISVWTGREWRGLTGASLATDAGCSFPNQTAAVAGRLIVWGDRTSPAMAFDPATHGWEEIAAIPLQQMEAPPGPLVLGDRFLVTRWLEGAIYDPATDEWTTVELPGLGTDIDMVWTGEEVLMWSKCCYGPADVDAWRWRPPDRG